MDWMEWIPMVPSKNAVASRSGLRGHHSTWNAQLSADGSYLGVRFGSGNKFADAHLPDDLGRLWVPTQRTIVLTTG